MENVVEVDAHKDDDVVEVGAKKADGPWTSKNEAIFIKLMDLEVPGRPKDTFTFKKEAWNRIIVQLRAKTGYNYNYEQLRNKYNTLRTTYNAFKKLLNETSGVGWDPKRQTITLADDVWKNLCKVNKHARQFKKKGCPHYDKLGRIYGKTSAIGEYTHVSTQLPSSSEEEKDPTFDPTNEVDKGNDNENDKEPNNRSRSRSITPPCSRRRKKDDVMVGLTSALNVLVETSKKKNEYLEYKMSGAMVATSSYGDSEVTNHKNDLINECMAALNALEDIDANGYSKAITKFSEGMIWRKLFMAMSDHRKRDWITCL